MSSDGYHNLISYSGNPKPTLIVILQETYAYFTDAARFHMGFWTSQKLITICRIVHEFWPELLRAFR